MSGMSNYLANAIINTTLRNVPFLPPSSVYLALFTSDPTDNNIGGEINAPSYTRQQFLLNAPVNGVSTNVASIVFNAATTNWGLINYIGVYDALTGGNLLYSDVLNPSQVINANEIFRIYPNDLTITLL
jgi:hypothetical protein